MQDQATPTASNTIPMLTKIQRRILGVLVEKGMTTPEQYPLTLNSLVAGSNQKSNRDPIAQYTEDAISQAIEELMEQGWMLSVQTSGGRTERYRHQVRVKLQLNEMELAILTELWLRGQQQLGELRTRASRMSNIETQEILKDQLESMLQKNYIQSTGPLAKRGIDVDHNFYTQAEQERRKQQSLTQPGGAGNTGSIVNGAETPQMNSQPDSSLLEEVAALRDEVARLRDELQDLKRQFLG
jgi:uncharacterized protein YceH (UPF0502 family)